MSVSYHSECKGIVLRDGINFHLLAAVIHITRSVPTSQECRRASHEGNATRARRCFLLVTTFLCTHKEHFVFVRLCIRTPFSFFTYFVPTGCQLHAHHRIMHTVCVIGQECVLNPKPCKPPSGIFHKWVLSGASAEAPTSPGLLCKKLI